jgi:hypothetical protein
MPLCYLREDYHKQVVTHPRVDSNRYTPCKGKLDQYVTYASLGLARSQRPRLMLALMAPRVHPPRDLSQMRKYETLK